MFWPLTLTLTLTLALLGCPPPDPDSDDPDPGTETDSDEPGPDGLSGHCPTPEPDRSGDEPWHFTEVAGPRGAAVQHTGTGSDALSFSAGVAAGDVDGDCYLDLYITTGGSSPEKLLMNRGDGSFVDRAAVAGVQRFFVSSAPLFADLDGDGDPELIVGSVTGGPTSVYENLGDGSFADMTEAWGLDTGSRDTYAAAVSDWDRDGDLDLSLAHWTLAQPNEPRRLWRNDGGVLVDVSASLGISSTVENHFFSTRFADLDGDGWPDLLVSADFGLSRVYRNEGGGVFTERAAELGLDDTGQGRGVLCHDFDRDGDVDIFVANANGTSRLFRNDGGNRAHFLEVLAPVGTRIEVEAGGRVRVGEIPGGGGFQSGTAPELHFGLGEVEQVDAVRVRWTDGGTAEWLMPGVDRVLVLRR